MVNATLPLYCHGLPGSARELDLTGNTPGAEVLAPDITALTGPARRVVGFSLGAMQAVKLAAANPDAVSDLVLISPAAPLELGNFLPDMAGRVLFKTARLGTLPLAALLSAQATAMRFVPGKVLTTMLATEPPADRALLSDPNMREILSHGLVRCLGAERRSYRRTLRAYVKPWVSDVLRLQCPVQIIYGSADTWTPPAMARMLSLALPDPPSIIRFEDAGHYGALIAALQGRADVFTPPT